MKLILLSKNKALVVAGLKVPGIYFEGCEEQRNSSSLTRVQTGYLLNICQTC